MTRSATAPTAPVDLPGWAVVRGARRRHIERVTALLDAWAVEAQLPADEASAWHDAGRWHDALRDAPLEAMRAVGEPLGLPPQAWHGAAAAERLEEEGETRTHVLEAIRWHTVGSADWAPVGRALYCADFLEPGRGDPDGVRAALVARFAREPDAVFDAVLARRVAHARHAGLPLHPRTAALVDSR